MAYCRGEVYAYGNGHGYSIHVARSEANPDGQHYHVASLEAFRDRMKTLRASGLPVPYRVFERIEHEIKERDKKNETCS